MRKGDKKVTWLRIGMGKIIQSKKSPYALLTPKILIAVLLFLLTQRPIKHDSQYYNNAFMNCTDVE